MDAEAVVWTLLVLGVLVMVVLALLLGRHVRALLAEALFHADHQVSGAPVHD